MKMERIIAVRNQKTIYRSGDQCIKVFNEDYSKADVLNEALNQARAEETGLRIPRILEVTTVEGRWAIVSEYIGGKTLCDLMQENKADFAKYLTMYVDLQLAMHAMTCPMLGRLKDKLNRKISQAELDAAARRSLQARLQKLPDRSQLCHGDFNPSNIIITPDGAPYILDWAHAAQGDACADAALTCLFFRLSGDTAGAQKYLDLFCQKSGTTPQQVHNWLPIAAASRYAKGNIHEREFLLGYINAANDQ